MSSGDENEYSSGDDEDYVPEVHQSSEDENADESRLDNQTENLHKQDDSQAKLKVDELWQSFKADTLKSDKRKDIPSGSKSATNATENENHCNGEPKTNGSASNLSDKVSTSLPSETKKNDTITITKVYDFAGEKVEVTKQVKADSKEAQNHLKQQSATSSVNRQSNSGLLKKRPGGGIGNVLGKLGKKAKLSTLEKSKLDWDNFKEAEGIEDELQSYKKGREGYLEKVSFLERTDMRQFQREKEMRLGRLTKR